MPTVGGCLGAVETAEFTEHKTMPSVAAVTAMIIGRQELRLSLSRAQ